MRGTGGDGDRETGWAGLIRGAPIGVLILSALLFALGAGMVLGGVYLAIAGREAGWMMWSMALLVGPIALYLSLHLLRRSSWAWLAVVALFVLLLASSLVRALGESGFPVSPLIETALEGLILAYLVRPPIRRSFGWS